MARENKIGPFIDELHARETSKHVRMKNTAVYWLISQGLDVEEIEDEAQLESGAFADLLVQLDDGSKIIVECENSDSLRTMARRRKPALKQGHQVYCLTPDGFYELQGRQGIPRAINPQLTLSEFTLERYGRWFANGREADSIDIAESVKWSTGGIDGESLEDPRGPRWKADGEPKPKKNLWELETSEMGKLLADDRD